MSNIAVAFERCEWSSSTKIIVLSNLTGRRVELDRSYKIPKFMNIYLTSSDLQSKFSSFFEQLNGYYFYAWDQKVLTTMGEIDKLENRS